MHIGTKELHENWKQVNKELEKRPAGAGWCEEAKADSGRWASAR